MRVLLAPVGSRGDVQPMIALADGLRRAGHDVTLAVPSGMEALAAAHGVPAIACGSDVLKLVQAHAADLHRPVRTFRILLRECRRELQLQLDEMERLVPGHDLVVGAGLQFAAAAVCAAHGVAFRHVLYTPCLLPAPDHPPFWLPRRRLPGWLCRWLHWAPDVVNGRLLLAPLARYRAAHRLPAIGLPTGEMIGDLPLLACEPGLAAAPGRFAAVVEQTGWLPPPQGPHQALDGDLAAWLDAGPPPIQIGFGSMTDRAPAATVALCERLAQRTGRRVLLLRGWSDHPTSPDPSVLVIDGAPHAALLPRCALTIHHGGSGTSHASAAAGVPQIVVPHLFDQFDFAARLEAAGVAARPLPRAQWQPDAHGVERVAARVAEALNAPTVLAKCRTLAAEMAARDGVGAAVLALERQVAMHKAGTWRPPLMPQQPPWRRQILPELPAPIPA